MPFPVLATIVKNSDMLDPAQTLVTRLNTGERIMAKGLDKKKETKKKPEKTLKEKRAEKAAKKG